MKCSCKQKIFNFFTITAIVAIVMLTPSCGNYGQLYLPDNKKIAEKI